MKAKLCLGLLFCFLMAIDVPGAITNKSISASDDETTIHIRQTSTGDLGSPRVPAYNPFYAELDDDVVLLGSVSGVGIVSVELASTTGDSYSTWFDTSDGSVIIPISGNPGDYTLLITMGSGVQFIGEFTL